MLNNLCTLLLSLESLRLFITELFGNIWYELFCIRIYLRTLSELWTWLIIWLELVFRYIEQLSNRNQLIDTEMPTEILEFFSSFIVALFKITLHLIVCMHEVGVRSLIFYGEAHFVHIEKIFIRIHLGRIRIIISELLSQSIHKLLFKYVLFVLIST